jgi:magnesium-transporting ATPase (P-type)
MAEPSVGLPRIGEGHSEAHRSTGQGHPVLQYRIPAPPSPSNPFPFKGLTDAEVIAARAKHGRNAIADKSSGTFWPAVKGAVLEPMFLLLLATSIIYFVLGERTEAYFMAGAIVLVSGISIYQDSRSRKALGACASSAKHRPR